MNYQASFLFSLLILSCSLRSDAYSHSNQFAEKLIRDLNLFPDVSGSQGSIEGGGEVEKNSGPVLVEKRINLPILGDSGSNVTLEELGHHAGYYSLNSTHAARMFYFFFESRGKSSDPVVIWLTGGPGCSSELALFYENGPYKIGDNNSLYWNDYGWDKASNLIYVDQPTGTGFSYSTDPRDTRFGETTISNDLYNFLQAFFTEHPQFLDNEFYITGESYAGHYIPAFASRVHQGNKNNEGLYINLKGFAIGNGLTDPEIQYGAYGDFALEMGLIGETTYKTINKIFPLCKLGIKLCGTSGTLACIASLTICNSIFNSILAVTGNINYYDVRTKCVGSLCYDFSAAENFLNNDTVKEALGVAKNRNFVSCNSIVYEALIADWMRNLETGIPALLEDDIKMLIYAGEYDLICNWLGNYRWVNSMDWSGNDTFAKMNMTSFTVDGEEAGLIKSYGPLSFLKVHDAGHMVPMDQPKAALEMLIRWTSGKMTEQLDAKMLAQTSETVSLLSSA
ncbi:hypothetical protein LUZ60_012978 [Juncus effusus]|nr:hypothetical protein LUZ60_012978 [Juncus effusus]